MFGNLRKMCALDCGTITFMNEKSLFPDNLMDTGDIFYVRREVDLMETAKVNAYIMHIYGKTELLSVHAS